jgi:hypothetical protein
LYCHHEDKDASFFVNARPGETGPQTYPQQKLIRTVSLWERSYHDYGTEGYRFEPCGVYSPKDRRKSSSRKLQLLAALLFARTTPNVFVDCVYRGDRCFFVRRMAVVHKIECKERQIAPLSGKQYDTRARTSAKREHRREHH